MEADFIQLSFMETVLYTTVLLTLWSIGAITFYLLGRMQERERQA